MNEVTMLNRNYTKQNTIVLIDNGHGADGATNGKFSPKLDPNEFNIKDPTVYDGRFREGNCNRIIAKGLADALKDAGVESKILVPEDKDISLSERVKRANEFAKKHPDKAVIFISLHSNACGSGNSWEAATGFSSHVARNASLWSKELAKKLWEAAEVSGYKGNRWRPEVGYHINDFYVIKKTNMPAVLTESLFYDNKEDLHKLMDAGHRKRIVNYLLAGILNFLN